MLFVNLRPFAGISEEIASNISITSERGFRFYETKLRKTVAGLTAIVMLLPACVGSVLQNRLYPQKQLLFR